MTSGHNQRTLSKDVLTLRMFVESNQMRAECPFSRSFFGNNNIITEFRAINKVCDKLACMYEITMLDPQG